MGMVDRGAEGSLTGASVRVLAIPTATVGSLETESHTLSCSQNVVQGPSEA